MEEISAPGGTTIKQAARRLTKSISGVLNPIIGKVAGFIIIGTTEKREAFG